MLGDKSFCEEVERRSGQNIRLCYQCFKCLVGCPVSVYMDLKPNWVIRMIEFGMRERVLKSHSIWLCVSCMTCGVRCPNEIDMSVVMDTLREMSVEAGYAYEAEKNVVMLHEEFVRSIKMWGRVHEASMLMVYKMRSFEFLTDMDSAFKLIMKGKIPFIPHRIPGVKAVRELFARTYDKARERKE